MVFQYLQTSAKKIILVGFELAIIRFVEKKSSIFQSNLFWLASHNSHNSIVSPKCFKIGARPIPKACLWAHFRLWQGRPVGDRPESEKTLEENALSEWCSNSH